jgi:HK97 family phage major capsid protein
MVIKNGWDEPVDDTIPGGGFTRNNQHRSSNGFNSLGEQLQAVYRAKLDGYKPDSRLYAENRAVTGMQEGVPSSGGFLLESDYSAELLGNMFRSTKIANKCRTIPISNNSNSIKLPALDSTSRVDGSRPVRAYWKSEGAQLTENEPVLRNINLEVNKLTGLMYVTSELLQDVPALDAYAKSWWNDEFAFKADDSLIRGTGTGQPLGVLNANALISVAKETGQNADSLVAENVEKMYRRFYGNPGSSAWLIHRSLLPEIFNFKHAVGTGGVSMFIPEGGLTRAPNMRLFNIDLLVHESCSTLGDLGDIFLIDFSQIYLATRGGIQFAKSIDLRFDYDEVAFRWIYRMDAQPIWNSAVTEYKGSSSVSPYVTLAERA